MRVVSAAVLITAFAIGIRTRPAAGSSHPDLAPVLVTPANPPTKFRRRAKPVQPTQRLGRTSILPAGGYAGWNAIAPARCAARGDRSTKIGALRPAPHPTQLHKVRACCPERPSAVAA